MASFVTLTFNKLLFLLVIFTSANCSKLNVPHVLLPIFTDVKVHFTLEAVNGGCYKWSTTRMDVVQLISLDPDPKLGCSSKAVVYSISKEPTRNIAVVLAEEVQSQLVLRVDVIVDVIDSLQIATTTKEIIMHEVPEVFTVVAHDSQGNQFTSLEGIEFDWKIICLSTQTDLSVLRIMTFKESPYETPPSVAVFEEKNKRGHIVLLEGIKTGTAKVHVRLPYAEYLGIKPCEVQLLVVANLLILPADVYIMPYDVVQFKVFSMNNGKMEEIKLPNSQYYLDVETNSIATADPQTGEVTGLQDGKTRVILHDRNVNENDPSIKLPAATINVCAPAYITVTLLPHKNWAVMVNNRHDLLVEVFSSKDHKLQLGPGVELHVQVGDAFFVQERSQNGTWLTGWAKEAGIAPVKAVLEGVTHKRKGKAAIGPVTASEEILIYPTIVLNPSDVILPWDPIAKPKYQIQVAASGGDGKFLWSSSNHSIGVVSQTGLVRTHSIGQFEVSAAMQRNHHNRESSKFYIIPPSRLEIVEYIMEAEIGSLIFLHVALFAEKTDKEGKISQMPFTQCQDLPFKVKTSDSHFTQNRNEVIQPIGISCANIAVVSGAVGSSKVTIAYNKEGRYLEDSVTVSTFKPLKLISPQRNIVLAVGTTVQLIYTGGPIPGVGRQSDYKRNVITENTQIADAQDITKGLSMPNDGNEYSVIKVLCRKLGHTNVTLSIINSPIIPNSKAQDATIPTTIICGKPRSISVQPEIKVADVEACPMDLSSERVIVQSNQDVELDVIVRDEAGLRFLNISSLKFDWSIEPSGLGVLFSKNGVFSRDVMVNGLNFGNKSYQVVTPKTDSGLLKVNTKIIGYHKNVLSKFKISAEWPEFLDEHEKGKELPTITASITLYLVDDTVVTPDELTIYNHPANKKLIDVKQGSGYYEILLSSPDIADVTYSSNSRQIEIIPRVEGELKISLIDLCLVSKPAVIVTTVVSVSIIRVEMSDKVEIDKCIPCIVKLYDESDNLLSVPSIDMIQIKVDQGPSVASFRRLTPEKDKPWSPGHIHYIIQGEHIGDSRVTFRVETVESAALDLQVFAPLRILPRNVTLLMGASIQYTQDGGPEPDSNIEYIVLDHLAEISQNGILTGLKLGSAKVTARALGVNPTTGQKVIYATDSVDATIIPAQGFKIKAPLTRFKLLSEVPAWATGLPEQLSPMILGTVSPEFIFHWSVDDPDILELHGVFQPIGINYDPEDQITIRMRGLRTGKTKLHLNVTVPGAVAKSKKSFVVFLDSIDIEVFEGLALKAPAGFSGKTILMAPHAGLQLQTNMDSRSTISYKLVGEDFPGEAMQRSLTLPNPIITVSQDGLLKSHSQLGYSMVLIVATDDHGLQQTLSIIVEVKPIYYMRLNVVANWNLQSNELHIIPLGTEFELQATYHDNTGNEFTAGTAVLHVRTSRFDLLRIKQGTDNSTLYVSIKKPGITVVKVWADGIQKTADYIKFNVGQTVTPTVHKIVTGDILCMWTPVRAPLPGLWSSTDNNLLTIDEVTGIGIAVATKAGQAAIIHNLHPVAPLQLQVLPISSITFVATALKHSVTNSANNKPYEIPLIISGDMNGKKNNLETVTVTLPRVGDCHTVIMSCWNRTDVNLPITTLTGSRCLYVCITIRIHEKTGITFKEISLNSWQCQDNIGNVIKQYPFSCEVDFANTSIDIDINHVFNIESTFNGKTGMYACKLTPSGVSDPHISTLDTKINVLARSQSNTVTSETLQLQFLPGIFVEREIILDDYKFSADLIITGIKTVLDGISVTPTDPNLLQVSSTERVSANLLKFNVKLVDYHWKLNEFEGPLMLRVNSELTDEHIKVNVRVLSPDKFSGSECGVRGGSSVLGSFLYSYRYIIVIIISMVVIFLGTFYAYSQYIHPVINVNVTPVRSLLQSTPSPNRGIGSSDSCTCRPGMMCQVTSPHRCNAAQYMQSGQQGSPNQLNMSNNMSMNNSRLNMSLNTTGASTGASGRDPVYGDPTSFYSTSPELRRNRRFM